ncbi:MAG: hypothetical protein GY810_10075 [Aureispira sp.]|nr:hypothetical protein [Aureispira sp.]
MLSTKLLYCLFFICCSSFLFAQEVVSVGRYSILYEELRDKTTDGIHMDDKVKLTYHIYSKLTNKKVFEIEKNNRLGEYINLKRTFGEGTKAKVPVWVEDFNFDGNLDFGVFNTYYGGAYGKPSYDMYIYDSQKKNFVFHKELSSLSNISDHGGLSFDPTTKTISHTDGDNMHATRAIYEMEGHNLSHVKSNYTVEYNAGEKIEDEFTLTADVISIDFTEEGGQCTFILTIYNFENTIPQKKLEETGNCEDLYKVLKDW